MIVGTTLLSLFQQVFKKASHYMAFPVLRHWCLLFFMLLIVNNHSLLNAKSFVHRAAFDNTLLYHDPDIKPKEGEFFDATWFYGGIAKYFEAVSDPDHSWNLYTGGSFEFFRVGNRFSFNLSSYLDAIADKNGMANFSTRAIFFENALYLNFKLRFGYLTFGYHHNCKHDVDINRGMVIGIRDKFLENPSYLSEDISTDDSRTIDGINARLNVWDGPRLLLEFKPIVLWKIPSKIKATPIGIGNDQTVHSPRFIMSRMILSLNNNFFYHSVGTGFRTIVDHVYLRSIFEVVNYSNMYIFYLDGAAEMSVFGDGNKMPKRLYPKSARFEYSIELGGTIKRNKGAFTLYMDYSFVQDTAIHIFSSSANFLSIGIRVGPSIYR